MTVSIRFEYGQQDRMSDVLGPFEFIQATYDVLRVGPDGDREIAFFDTEKHLWTTEDGQQWSDFVTFAS